MPSIRRILAPVRRNLAFAGRGDQEVDNAPLWWASSPLVRAPTSGPSGPSRRVCLPRSNSNGSPSLVGPRICSGGWWFGGSAASTGGGVSCIGGSKPAPSSGTGIGGVPALMTSKSKPIWEPRQEVSCNGIFALPCLDGFTFCICGVGSVLRNRTRVGSVKATPLACGQHGLFGNAWRRWPNSCHLPQGMGRWCRGVPATQMT